MAGRPGVRPLVRRLGSAAALVGVAVVLLSSVTLGSGAVPVGVVAGDGGPGTAAGTGGPIALADGTSGDAVARDRGGDLTIDVSRLGSATGIPPAARYELGDPADPTAEHAFSIVSRASGTHTLAISYALAPGAGDDDPDPNVGLRVYDASGEPVGTASEEDRIGTVRADGPTTYYVVVVIDTHGLGAGADLSGSIRVSLA